MFVGDVDVFFVSFVKVEDKVVEMKLESELLLVVLLILKVDRFVDSEILMKDIRD